MALTTVRLPDDLIDQLDRLAEARDVTRSDVVREALERYCRRVKPARRRSRRSLVESLVDYPGSGVDDRAQNSERYLRQIFDVRRHRRPR